MNRLFVHIKQFYLSLFPGNSIYYVSVALTACFLLAYFLPSLFLPAKGLLLLVIILLITDVFLLYRNHSPVQVSREVPDAFSNGDPHDIHLHVNHDYPFQVRVQIIDEAPTQFQQRYLSLFQSLAAGEPGDSFYELRPTSRGEYHFGKTHVFVSSPLQLLRRRISLDHSQTIPCYPSFLQLKKYQLLASSNRLTEVGIKNVRRLGHTSEFEQIKQYVHGDDFRTINWKATARMGKLMINQYTDQRSQQVYCLIDKSRNMQMPDQGMTLLDYAINASLVMSYIALYKHDQCGLITFSEKIDESIPASRRQRQMSLILEALYKQQTEFMETDYERLYAFVKRKITQRSLLILFTNFDTLSALNRQLPYLQGLARMHLLLVVFFENTGLKEVIQKDSTNLRDVYVKTIAESMNWEKRQIAKALEKSGIATLLVTPKGLTIDVINEYIAYKAKGMI